MLLLDINDTRLNVIKNGESVYSAPGVAVIERKAVLFGDDAARQSRFRPGHVHDEFWHRLNTDPLAVAPSQTGGWRKSLRLGRNDPAKALTNQADLVYEHLRHMHQAASIGNDDVVVMVPSVVKPPQLSMLLGIAVEAKVNVRAVVDAAIAAASIQPFADHCRFLDLSQHGAFVVDIESADGAVTRGEVHEIREAGYRALVSGWVDAVADQFVGGTRFDPSRVVATEQQLYDQVLDAVGQRAVSAADGDLTFTVEHDAVERSVTVTREALAAKAEERYDLMITAVGPATTVLVSHRLGRLPGLTDRLQAAGHEVRRVGADAARAGTEAHPKAVEADGAGEGAKFVTSLPHPAARRQRTQTATNKRRMPSHLLCSGIALRLGDTLDAKAHPANASESPSFRIRRIGTTSRIFQLEDAEVRVNGEILKGNKAVYAGDRVDWGDLAFELIAAVDR